MVTLSQIQMKINNVLTCSIKVSQDGDEPKEDMEVIYH